MQVLGINGVTRYFGGLPAVRDVSFSVGANEIVGLIGPNGAGKTTLLNCVSGIHKPTAGSIRMMDREITRLKPHQVCRAGIGRTFQIPRPFHRMTVEENVRVAQGSSRKPPSRYMELVGLVPYKATWADRLTFHQRRKLEVARALAVEPRLLLLDEVMAGLNPTETEEMVGLVRTVREETGVSILWVEHVMRAVMECADRLVVLHQGQKLTEGAPADIARDERVIEVYLGERYHFKDEITC
ncbi:MAG: ABC transporter ATP-binding protein [Bacillota bacterium]